MAIFIGKPPDRVLTEEALDPDDNFLIAICESGSAKSARNPRLGEAGRNGGKDSKMRGIRQNRKPHIIKEALQKYPEQSFAQKFGLCNR